MRKATTSLTRSGTAVELLPTSNQEDEATLTGVGPRRKYEIKHEFTRSRRSERMNPTMKIKKGIREGKLPGAIRVEAMGVVEAGVVGIVMFATVLGS